MASIQYYDVIIRPVITEKSMADMGEKKYTFLVHPEANKTQIKEAVEKMFEGTKVKSVNTINSDGKKKRRGMVVGKTAKTKKAIVALTEESKDIEIFEGDKIDKIFPLMAQPENKGWQVIALLSDDTGIPKSAEDRLKVFDKIMAKAKEYGISPDRIHIDPLVEMLCTSEDGIAMNVEVISSVRKQYPMIHITAAISNISFNLPVRKLINFGFVVLAMNAGLDSAIMDPTNRDMLGLVYATEALLGLDDYCMEYIGAYREGLIGPVKK